jgi:hypothetical protein
MEISFLAKCNRWNDSTMLWCTTGGQIGQKKKAGQAFGLTFSVKRYINFNVFLGATV